MQSNTHEQTSDPVPDRDTVGSDRRGFLQQAGIASLVLASMGFTKGSAVGQSMTPDVGPTPPLDFKALDYKTTKTTDSTEVTLVHQITGGNGIKAVTSSFLKRSDYGQAYVVMNTISVKYFTASADPTSDQPYHITNAVGVQFGKKGPISGQERTDTIESFWNVNGVTSNDTQTVQVSLKAPFDVQGLSIEDVMKKVYELKKEAVDSAVDKSGVR
ncbi:MAG TPA: hypothetical protein VMS18_11495 [Candidatus Binatia bacterium]|nr:hypothetical protein [Candidatus Binatia bacterium]